MAPPFRLLILAWIATLLVLHANDSTASPSPASKAAGPDLFSYRLPPGWRLTRAAGEIYPVAADDATGAPKAFIVVGRESVPIPLDRWCSQSLARHRDIFVQSHAKVGDLERFTTEVGAIGYRAPIDLEVRAKEMHYVMYFFNGYRDTKFAITCVCSAPDADHYAPIFEAAMKTFVPRG